MWGYIIVINLKRLKNKLLKVLSLLDFYFMIILICMMFKNIYMDIEIKRNVFIIIKIINKMIFMFIKNFEFIIILLEFKLYEKIIIFIM